MESMQTELFGGAGHSYEIVKRLSGNGKLIGIDRDEEALKAAKEKLMESAQKVFTKMYEQQAQANGAAGAGPDMNAGADNSSYQSDDVVDGDYKEV